MQAINCATLDCRWSLLTTGISALAEVLITSMLNLERIKLIRSHTHAGVCLPSIKVIVTLLTFPQMHGEETGNYLYRAAGMGDAWIIAFVGEGRIRKQLLPAINCATLDCRWSLLTTSIPCIRQSFDFKFGERIKLIRFTPICRFFAFHPLKFKFLCQHFLKCTLKIVYYSQIIKQGLQDMQDQLWYKIKIIHPFQNAEKILENFLTHIPEKLVKTKIVFFLHSRKSSTIPCVCDEGWTFDPANIDVWCCYDRTDWLTFSYVKKK